MTFVRKSLLTKNFDFEIAFLQLFKLVLEENLCRFLCQLLRKLAKFEISPPPKNLSLQINLQGLIRGFTVLYISPDERGSIVVGVHAYHAEGTRFDPDSMP